MSEGFDLGALLDSASQMQQQLLAAQQEAAAREFEGQAGGGVVKVTVTGAMEFRSVAIDPQVIDPSDAEMLQDLVLAALHDAVAQVNAAQQQAVGAFDPSSLDLGGLFGGAGLGAGEPEDDDDEDDEDDADDED